MLDDEQPLHTVLEGGVTPVLSPATPAHEFLFPDTPDLPLALALLPLMYRGQCLGSLNLGSMDAQHFVDGSHADALQRLAALLAVCLHNALATERLALADLTDALTGVHSRHYFEARCLEEAHAAQRRGPALPCLLIDVDHLRQVNDSLGHPAGDEVLRWLAHLLTVQLRGYDVLARYGGGTFVLLLPGTALTAAVSVAERICRSVAAQDMALPEADVALHVTVSIGLSLLRASTRPGDFPQCIADMLERAGRALYRAKEEGRDRVAVAAATDG
jgi:diguanylate cyclase (GGDEF)-like protein